MQVGQSRLLKAYKIIVETKSPNTFECHYKAIICYNLACSYQLQGELDQCAVFLRQAIKFVDQKLEQLPLRQ